MSKMNWELLSKTSSLRSILASISPSLKKSTLLKLSSFWLTPGHEFLWVNTSASRITSNKLKKNWLGKKWNPKLGPVRLSKRTPQKNKFLRLWRTLRRSQKLNRLPLNPCKKSLSPPLGLRWTKTRINSFLQFVRDPQIKKIKLWCRKMLTLSIW